MRQSESRACVVLDSQKCSLEDAGRSNSKGQKNSRMVWA